jgi:ubiquinone/menaquinone biosynthesis C-methylase UbiE
MGLYSKLVLPYLTDFAMRDKAARARRSQLVPGADGIVLEIGVGSGLNLPFYSPAVRLLYAVDPSPELLAMTRKKVERMTFPVDLRCESAERLSLDSGSVDTIVMTWALCSIPNPARALREMGRVLKPRGRMIFIEHGLSPNSGVRAWQNGLNPIWSRVTGGCNLNRKIDDLLISSGFHIVELRTAYLPGPRPMTYTYEGCAVPETAPA